MTTADANPPTVRTRVRRVAHRGHYDRTTLHAILDEAYVCHVAFADELGVHCIPTACWREGDHLYIHGSNGSRMLKLAGSGAQVCVTVTHIDGLVLARSAFNHSMNYRSLVVYGAFQTLPAELKEEAMHRLMDHIAPGRRHEARAGDANELAATTVLRLPLHEAATKVRTGGPEDDAADMAWPAWAGVLPITRGHGQPQPDAGLLVEAPAYVRDWAAAR